MMSGEEYLPKFWTKKEDIPDEAFPIVCRTVLSGHSGVGIVIADRSEEHTSELQSLMRISYAVFCLKKKKNLSYKKSHKVKSYYNPYRHKSLTRDSIDILTRGN